MPPPREPPRAGRREYHSGVGPEPPTGPTRNALMPIPFRYIHAWRLAIGLSSVCLLAACAGSPSGTPTPLATPTPSTSPTAAAASPSGRTLSASPAAQGYLVPIAGYEYV